MESGQSGGPRIAILGAGSISLGPSIINDLLSQTELDGAVLTLMAPHQERLGVVERWALRAVRQNGLQTVIRATTSRREALSNADYVLALFDGGGFSAFDADYRIATSYGLDICIGDAMGPTGIMKGLRNIAVLEDVARDYRELCPEAPLLTYVNPMAPLVMAADSLGIRGCVGLCGGIEATRELIGECLELAPQQLQTHFAGINHMCWALRIEHAGRDLYPLFRERMTRAEWRAAEPARAEVLQHFGYIPTETSGHLSDMLPWFRRDAEARRRYGQAPGYAGASGIYHRYASYLQERLAHADYLRFEDGTLAKRSGDYGATIVTALHRGQSVQVYGNVVNSAQLIGNLPSYAAVEVPLQVGATGIHGIEVGMLPPQLAALCTTNLPVHQLTVAAALQKDPELAAAAVSLDPLTQAVLDLPRARELAAELLVANAGLIPEELSSGLAPLLPVGADAPATPRRSSFPSDGPLAALRRFDRRRRGESPGAAADRGT